VVSRATAVLLAGLLMLGGAMAAPANAVEPPADVPTAAVLDVARALTTTLPYVNKAEHLAHAEVGPATGMPAAKKTPPRPNRKAERVQATVAAARPLPDGPSPSGPLGIPERAMSAYRTAAAAYGSACALPWEVLAAIGRAESGHANGGQLYPDGLTWEPILGPVLNGSPFAAIRDTDGGALDGDEVWDRAVGPMQFIPGTWDWIGVDGDGDGAADPNDIDDAAAGAARYLCVHGGDLTDADQLRTAILRYNNSGAYADAVMAWADGYAGRATTVADPESPPKPTEAPEGRAGGSDGRGGDDRDGRDARDSREGRDTGRSAEPAPDKRTPAPKPTPSPQPTPTPKPTPTPSPAEPPAPTPTPTQSPPSPEPPPQDEAGATATASPTGSPSEPPAVTDEPATE
jgi:membrane-bound lytic murein transglycosylase B